MGNVEGALRLLTRAFRRWACCQDLQVLNVKCKVNQENPSTSPPASAPLGQRAVGAHASHDAPASDLPVSPEAPRLARCPDRGFTTCYLPPPPASRAPICLPPSLDPRHRRQNSKCPASTVSWPPCAQHILMLLLADQPNCVRFQFMMPILTTTRARDCTFPSKRSAACPSPAGVSPLPHLILQSST
jgi:hypothetical protein